MLVYFSHRYSDPDPAKRAANLERARERMAAMQCREDHAKSGIKYHAPWMALAESGASLRAVWASIAADIGSSAMVELDQDGAPLSGGQRLEMYLATEMGLSWNISDDDLTGWLAQAADEGRLP